MPMRTRLVRAAMALARMRGAEAIRRNTRAKGIQGPPRGRERTFCQPDPVEPTRLGSLHQGESLLKGCLLGRPFAIVAFHDEPEMPVPPPSRPRRITRCATYESLP